MYRYLNVLKIQKAVTYNQARGAFGFSMSDNIGKSVSATEWSLAPHGLHLALAHGFSQYPLHSQESEQKPPY